MRAVLSVVRWILILAVVSQGAVPGVVVCYEPSGRIEFETVEDACCATGLEAAESGGPVALRSTLPDDTCGPCTDAPVTPAPVTKPARAGDIPLAAHSTRVILDTPSAIALRPSAGRFVATTAALIALRTTTLLI